MTLPVDGLYQVNVVVRDARASARQYAEFYGINRWQVAVVGHAGADHSYLSATGSNEVGGITFQLVQPLSGQSSFGDFLQTRGEGVHSLWLSEVGAEEFPPLRDWLAGRDIAIAESDEVDGATIHYLDTRAALGGYYLQVVEARRGDWRDALPVDEVWDLSAEVTRPRNLDFVARMEGVNHFGVVVPDLLPVLENYARIFGTTRWRGYHWRTEPGSLEESMNNGVPVVHGFSTGRADIGRDRFGRGFGFEVVQPDFGPSHFKDDFLDVVGPGIHHLSLNLVMKDVYEWVDFNKWLETLGPVCMSGWLRDHSAMYIYTDLRERLAHVVETGIRRRRGREPDLWYDFNPPQGAGNAEPGPS